VCFLINDDSLMKLGKNSLTTSILAILIGLCVVSSLSSAKAASEAPQPQWSKTYGGYRGNWVIQTADGGYAIAGRNATYSTEGRGYGNFAPLLIKTDSSGELQWGKTYEAGDFAPESVVQTKDLGYALGAAGSPSLVKTDAFGNVQWNKTFEPASYVAIQASDGGYVLTGYMPNNNGGENVLLLKTDENGNLLWNKTFSEGSAYLTANAVVEANDGGYAVAGSWGGSHFWFAEIDSNGNFQWNQTYYYPDSRAVSPYSFDSIAKTKDGGYMLAGSDGGSAWLVKTDSQGNAQLHHSYPGGEFGARFTSVVQTGDGGYLAVGWNSGPAWLVRTDASGNVKWNVTYGNENDGWNTASSVIVTKDGGFAVAGTLDDSVWLAKFAPESNTPPENTSPPVSTDWIVAATAIIAIAVVITLGVAIYRRKKLASSKTP
jgi:predicted secreted protein